MEYFKLPTLPYSENALEPYISAETISFHYGKHHKAYVDNLNKLIVGTEFEKAELEEIIQKSTGGIFNNAAQFYNHNIYWNCFSSTGGGEPTGKILDALKRSFGSFEKFKDEFTKASLSLFGSGWVWLDKKKDGTLEISQTTNADNPLRVGKNPIIAFDVWEHSYYIDRRNNRAAYVEAFWHIINWKAIEARL